MQALFPYKEAYYYFQRALMGSPGALCAQAGPTAHLLEGRFRLALLCDRTGEAHPFVLQGGIALKPHDGTGFIKESVAKKWPWYQAASEDRTRPFGGTEPDANLPFDALLHYPGNPRVAEELVGDGMDTLELRSEALYRGLVQGPYSTGHIAMAVPSSDGKLHLPRTKRVGRHVIVARGPYERAKLQPVAEADVATTGATSQALGEWVTLQYSFVARACDEDPARRELFFAKGLLVVVPEVLWPASYADRDFVLSAEDEKSRSSWITGKHRHRKDASFEAAGILSIGEVHGPGSAVATRRRRCRS